MHNLNNPLIKQLSIAAILGFSVLLFSTCGKRKPPLPPVERVPQRVEISGQQVGPNIYLVWQMPARNAAGGNALNISRADIYRLAEPLSAPLSLTEEEFASNSTLIGSVPISDSDFALKDKTYSDRLAFAGQQVRLRYAIRFVNASGQKAAFSNFFLIEPTSKIAAAPGSLAGEVTQDAIRLSWKSPEMNEDGTKPASVLGYNIYRSKGDEESKRVNDAPIAVNSFNDEFFEFQISYSYFVRAVSVGAEGQPIESSASNTIKLLPKDTFAPAAPGSITIAAAPNSISIFFATNLERDVVGYSLYRTTDPSKAKKDWQLLTPELLKTNTFQDSKVQSGQTYYYYLTATDRFGNVSPPSEAVSEEAF
ncbi:MAG: hypothetical protein R2681_11155 [Pyrinomonadaceae bacterium]